MRHPVKALNFIACARRRPRPLFDFRAQIQSVVPSPSGSSRPMTWMKDCRAVWSCADSIKRQQHLKMAGGGRLGSTPPVQNLNNTHPPAVQGSCLVEELWKLKMQRGAVDTHPLVGEVQVTRAQQQQVCHLLWWWQAKAVGSGDVSPSTTKRQCYEVCCADRLAGSWSLCPPVSLPPSLARSIASPNSRKAGSVDFEKKGRVPSRRCRVSRRFRRLVIHGQSRMHGHTPISDISSVSFFHQWRSTKPPTLFRSVYIHFKAHVNYIYLTGRILGACPIILFAHIEISIFSHPHHSRLHPILLTRRRTPSDDEGDGSG